MLMSTPATEGLQDGASVEELPELDRFTITGRGTCLITVPLFNRAAMKGREVTVGGQRVRVRAVEDCLVGTHHTGACSKPTGLLVEFLI